MTLILEVAVGGDVVVRRLADPESILPANGHYRVYQWTEQKTEGIL